MSDTGDTGDATDPVLEVEGLKKYYAENDGVLDRLLGVERTSVKAVDGVTFSVERGETLGLVGESGCGKSTTGETLLALEEPTDGDVRFDGESVFAMSGDELDRFRRRAQVVFQDPFSSLDPRMTAGEVIAEPLVVHDLPEGEDGSRSSRERRRERAKELLERVGLSAGQIDRYPHEFSGGQRQRIGIARALALDPEFIVLDEPVSALDVSVQAQILNLLDDLQDEFGLTYLFIAHDLSVVRHISDRVAVMYLGEIVERGPVDAIFEDPQHPYTEKLLESVPRADTSERGRRVEALQGDVPSPRNPPAGCRFHTRCPYAREACREASPDTYATGAEGQSAACFRAVEGHRYWESEPIEVAAGAGTPEGGEGSAADD
jgi:peptide/nickel transport system ATP-binding protein